MYYPYVILHYKKKVDPQCFPETATAAIGYPEELKSFQEIKEWAVQFDVDHPVKGWWLEEIQLKSYPVFMGLNS